VSELTAPAAPVQRRWQIEIMQRADLVFPLRDYFRRLGQEAEINGPTSVQLLSAEDPTEIEQWAATWATKKGAPLHVQEVTAQRRVVTTPPVPRTGAPRLGTLLVAKGYLTPDQLNAALAESKETGDLLGIVLLRSELIFEDELARTLSHQLSIPYISISRVGVDASVTRLLPPEVGASAAAIPVRAQGATMQVAFADPTDPQALAQVERYLPRIGIAVAELSDIRLAWRTATRAASYA
jgi:hypothetical protein